jgi:hypothetical protein
MADQCQARPRPESMPSDSYSDVAVQREIWYAIYHQGANVWRLSGMLKGEALKRALLGVDGSRVEIQNTSITRLETITLLALKQCVDERDIAKDLYWVCVEKHQYGDINNRANQKNYDAVRSVFSNTQAHDVNLRNRIYCLSNDQLIEIVQKHCPILPPSAPDPHPPHAPGH